MGCNIVLDAISECTGSNNMKVLEKYLNLFLFYPDSADGHELAVLGIADYCIDNGTLSRNWGIIASILNVVDACSKHDKIYTWKYGKTRLTSLVSFTTKLFRYVHGK